MGFSIGGGQSSSSSNSGVISPESVTSYYKTMLENTGLAPGYRGGYSSSTGNYNPYNYGYSSYNNNGLATIQGYNSGYGLTRTDEMPDTSGPRVYQSTIGSTGNYGTNGSSGYDLSSLLSGSGGSGIPSSNLLNYDVPYQTITMPSMEDIQGYYTEYPDFAGWTTELPGFTQFPELRSLTGGDYDRLESAIYNSQSIPLTRQQASDTEKFQTEMANRGLGNDPAYASLYGEGISDPYSEAYQQAAAAATQQRYNLQESEQQALNQSDTTRTQYENQFNLSRAQLSDSRDQYSTDYGARSADSANSFVTSMVPYYLQSQQLNQSNLYNYWNQIMSNWLMQQQLWASMIKNYGNSESDSYNFQTAVKAQ